jgi:glycosyltransferase involved in cell wall biosynthesis
MQLPRISIVTPSFNQGRFLDEAMRSVLEQDYPSFEYIVIDGGSTDDSLEVIRKYEKHLAFWTSEPDGGPYDAINRGFARSTGSVMAWLNADDKFLPGAFAIVGEIFASLPHVEWITTNYPVTWDADGAVAKCGRFDGFSREGFLHGENLLGAGWLAMGWIQQESTFWRRSLWESAGGRLDTSYDLASDFELWARFFEHAHLYGVDSPLGGFRIHGDQRSLNHMDRYVEQALRALACHGGRPGNVLWGLAAKLACNVLPGSLVGRTGLLSRGAALVRDKDARWIVVDRYIRRGGLRWEAAAMRRRLKMPGASISLVSR